MTGHSDRDLVIVQGLIRHAKESFIRFSNNCDHKVQYVLCKHERYIKRADSPHLCEIGSCPELEEE